MPAHVSGVMHAGPSPVWLPYPEDVNALMPQLWSRTAAKDTGGILTIAGHRVTDLVREHGSPLYILDIADLQAGATEFVEAFTRAFSRVGGTARAYYAGKALLTTKVARWVAQAGMGIDCCSLGELLTVRAAGVDPGTVGLHGNNKSDEEIGLALDWGIGRIVVDSLDEIARIEEQAAARDMRAPVMIRVTVGVEAHTHDFIATAHEDQKFGLSLATGAALDAVARVLESGHLDLLGFHSHIGSQIFDKAGFEVAARRIAALRARVISEHGVAVPEIDLGGGFGMSYTSQDTPVEPHEMARQLAEAVSRECAEAGTDLPVVSFEPGRSIIGPAVCTVYTVGTVKPVTTDSGVRTYVSVDGGMSDNVRTALYDADYSCTLASRASDAAPTVVRVVGKHCESGDIVVRDEYLPGDVRRGDLVVVPGTGAYCRPLASNYNMALRPGILAVDPDHVEWVLRPETWQDLFDNDPGMRDPRE